MSLPATRAAPAPGAAAPRARPTPRAPRPAASSRGRSRATMVRAGRGVSPLSGEAYDASSRSHFHDDDDEVVTSLWLPTRDLGVGDAGTDVGMLQEAFGLPATGVFDKATAREIARWQGACGLPKSGYFGAASRERFANDAAAGLFRREPRVRARDARALAPSTSARTHGAAEDDIAQRRFIGVDSYPYPSPSPAAPGSGASATASGSGAVAGAGAAVVLGLAGAALARRALPDVFGGDGSRGSNRRGESPFDRLERLDRVDAAEAADAEEDARRERARRFRDADAAGVAGRAVAASRSRKKYPLAPPNRAKLSSKSPFGHEPATAEKDAIASSAKAAKSSTGGSSVRTPPRAAQTSPRPATPSPSTTRPSSSGSSSSFSVPRPRDANSISSEGGTPAGSWTGRPQSFDELRGFTPKRASPVDEIAEVNRRAPGGGGRFVDERLKRTRRTTGADDADAADADARGFDPRRSRRGDFSSFGGTLREEHDAHRDADEDEGGDGNENQTRGSKEKDDTKRRETEDDESGGIGGALMRAFGLDRRKAEFIERQKSKAAAAAKEKRDEADERKETDEKTENAADEEKEEKREKAKTAEEGSDSDDADADAASSTASSPFSPEASSQMSYLERLKLEEAERVARVAEDKARRDAAKANAENRARIDAEKEALREERARLIREQTEREERRRAREEKKRAEVLEVAEGAEGAVEAEQARETEAPETPETPGTDAESGSDFAARVRAASMLAEKSRAAGRVLSDENAAAERVKEKEMSFEERVAAARAQAANSGVADQMKAMFSRTDGDERAEDAGKPEKSAEDAEGSEDEAEGSEETDEGSEDADPSPVPETDAALTERVRSDAEETSAARTEPDAPEPPELPEVASSPSDASVSDASLRALSDDMDAISDDDFHRRVAEAARAVDFAESVLSDASDSEAAAETEALEAEMAAKALEAALAEKEAAAKKAALRAKAARDDLAAQMAAQMRAAAEAEAEWERAMRDAADVADARRKEDEAHFDPDGWAERAQRDLDEAMQVFERAEKWDANEDDDEAKDEAVAEAEDEDDAGRSESVDAEGRRADPEPAAEESPAMTPEERRAALVRALRGVDTGVIMRGAKTDEKAPDEKAPEEKAPEEKAPEETAEDNSPEAKAASAEAENDSNKSNESNETDVSTAKDDSDAPSESQSSSPPKTTRKKGRFAAMLDEGAVEADYETSIRGTPPPPSKPSAAAEKTTSDPPEEEEEDDSYLLELDDDDYCAPDDEVCMWGLESKESLARALRGVNTSAIMTATETRGDDSNPEPEAEAPETDAREVEATPEAAPEPEPEAAPEPEPEPEPELDRAPEDSAAAPSPPEPKKEKKKGRFAAMLDEGAVEADYETSIRGTPPPAQKPAEEQEPAAADPEANSEPEETEPETAPEAEVPSAAPEVEEVKAEVDAPPAPPATKKGADWDEDKRSFAERVAAARAATQASASPQAPSKGPEPTPRAEPEPVPETAEPESESEPAAESAPFASPSSPESTMTAEERGAALARALRGLDTGAIMRAPVSEPEPEPEAEGIVADASDEVSAAPPAADEPKSEEDQKAKPKKKGRFAAMLDEGAVEADYATSIRGTPPPASESAEETPALEPTETVAKTKEEPKAEPAEAEPAEAEPAEAEAKLEVSAEPEPEPDAFATVDARPGYSMPIPRPAAPPGWWDTHEWPPAPSSEKTVAEATVEAEAETTVEPERDVEPENVPSPEPENVPSPEPSAPSPSPMNGHELRTPAPGASDAFFAARISAARDDIRAIHDELREELDDDADSGSSSNRPFVDPESESNDAFDAKVRRAIADAAMDADPTMMRDSDALDRARYAAMLQERARAAEGSARGADVDAESDSFALQPGDHQLRTPRDPTVAERSAFGPEYAYASVGRDGIAAGWRWRGMESSSAPTTDVDDWASETRRRLVPPARGAFMGAPASALQPNLASLADDAAAAAERAAAIEAANAAAEAEEQPRAESPDATTTTADSTPNREPQWRPPGGGASYDAAPMDRSRENTRAHPREEGEEIDEENLRPRGASFDEDDDVVAIAGDAAKADADANADGTGDSDETAETSPTDETSDEHDALTCVDEECFEEENLRPRNAVSSDEPWDGEEEEDDDEWNDAGPGYSSKRPWDDEESHMPPNMRG